MTGVDNVVGASGYARHVDGVGSQRGRAGIGVLEGHSRPCGDICLAHVIPVWIQTATELALHGVGDSRECSDAGAHYVSVLRTQSQLSKHSAGGRNSGTRWEG